MKHSFRNRRALSPEPVLESVLERTPRCLRRRWMTKTAILSVSLLSEKGEWDTY
jgi:hypothetical protein